MIQVAKRFPDYNFLLAGAPSTDKKLYTDILGNQCNNIILLQRETYSILRHSRAAIISSGTASLEAALIGTPQVVGYGGNEITYRFAMLVLKIKYISLANLIMDKGLFKELLQHDCTPDKLSGELDMLLHNKEYIDTMKQNYAQVREALGGKGASNKVAKAMVDELIKMKKQ